jgi:hypothetical protein
MKSADQHWEWLYALTRISPGPSTAGPRRLEKPTRLLRPGVAHAVHGAHRSEDMSTAEGRAHSRRCELAPAPSRRRLDLCLLGRSHAVSSVEWTRRREERKKRPQLPEDRMLRGCSLAGRAPRTGNRRWESLGSNRAETETRVSKLSFSHSFLHFFNSRIP